MTTITTRNSALAVIVETTEGDPKAPTNSSEYIALQDDFSMSHDRETLENNELRNSIGTAKPIQGVENPTASLSHYLRHSGVEGTEPNYGELLQGLLGNKNIASTERDTIAASTVSAINVDSGEGVEFIRGSALLIKHPSSPYEIRAVESVAGDVLTPMFDLANAPATGTNLGKSVTYFPADTGHISMTLWHFLGNQGAIQMMAGAKVTEGSFTFSAGELINAAYSLEGTGSFFDPIEVTATDTKLDFTDDSGTLVATITAKTYKHPADLASAIAQAMNDASPETYTVLYSNSTGKYTIATSTSALFSLLWSSGANTANTIGDVIGFDISDDTGSLNYDGDSAIDWSSPQNATFDTADPLVAKNNFFMVGDSTDNACFEASSVEITISNEKRDILDVCAESGKSGSIFNQRTATISITAVLEQNDADFFRRMQENDETKFQYNFGEKSGGNWVAGKSGCISSATAVVSSFEAPDDDGLIAANIELTTFVDTNGLGEIFIAFV